jgi:CSLREA domain-containing protein
MRVALVFLLVFTGAAVNAAAIDFTVTKTADTNDGVCDADCSLREAIAAANALAGGDRVILGTGQTYNLSLGELGITDALTIDGHGSTINGQGLSRVLNIQGGFAVTINDLTITGGVASGFLSLGGALAIGGGAGVILNNCTVTGNSTAIESAARDDGGGIAVIGSFAEGTGIATLSSLTLNNSTVSNNTGSNGGGIVCVLCALTISNSTISGNLADAGDGGGIDMVGNASILSMTSSALVNNTVSGGAIRGGGLSVPFGTGASTLTRNRIVSNTGTTGSALFTNLGAMAATNNWWGCNLGPGAGGSGCVGTTNSVSGAATTSPFLVLKGSLSPVNIQPGQSSTMTADLRFNSLNTDTSAGGTVPNGIAAAFAGALGTFATPSALTSSGKATDVFTAGGATGTPSLNTTVDGQTVGLLLNIGPNTAPTISSIANTRTTSATPVVVTFTVGDAETGASSVLVSGTSSDTTLVPNMNLVFAGSGASRTLTITSAPHLVGTTTITITASDGGLMTSTSFVLTVAHRLPGDLNADGMSDLIWRNKVSGQNIAWLMNGTALASSAFLPTIADTNWEIRGVADFDGDGKGDIVWRNKVTGQNIVWLMNGTSLAASAFLPAVADVNWEIKGVGDFDGDGKADLLWRNKVTGQDVVWLMNGAAIASSAFLPTIADLNWEFKGVGDFDGDGKADIILRNKATGQNIGWLMNGVTVAVSSFLPTIADTNWEIKGVGDIDADGKADVVWRNKSTGQNIGWLMNGLTVASSAFLPTIADTNWNIKSIGDVDGDGKADVIWRNSVSGQNIVWMMNGLMLGSSAFLPTIADVNWEIAGP